MKTLLEQIKEIYPNFKPPKCKLIGEDSNAFAIMGRVSYALKRAGYKKAVTLYISAAIKGDYTHLLAASMEVSK